RSRFDLNGRDLLHLRQGTEITISGEGEFRKLESISQYVLAASLQGEPAALTDQVVVLDHPLPIKAGNLIGHIGRYHECRAEHPEEKLHLEVFSGDEVDVFIEDSRTWAQRLPDKDKTWLKLARGTAVVPHEEYATAARLQMASASSPLSAADLLVPKSVLDALSADRKIQVPASPSHNARTWYRLDGLLHDADNNLLDGWVREEVGVTPWLNPWSWEGYDIIYDYGTPRHALASFFSNIRQFNETQLERYRPMADAEDKGPVKSRLFDIIDRNRDGKMTAEELQAAITLPAHAQSISQLIIYKESEWYHQPQKWDALDELLGHSGSTPHLNWLAEKQRIKQISWWSEVAEKVGLPSWGKVYHFHPVGITAHLNDNQKKCYCYQQGLIDAPCQTGLTDVTKKHFELLANELGVEKEVLRAIALAETGDKVPFKEYRPGEKHALILYERHYMRRFLLADGMPSSEVDALSNAEPKIVHTYEASYSYGSLDDQYSRLKRAREINRAAAIKSCSWGKFQVMGEYYRHLYESADDLEKAQNYCALQHLQYFKIFLTKEKNLIGPMKDKDWTLIAQKYNGKSQIGYDTKIRSTYENLKQNW
ncbi:N-acetylmuramidase domain-containing protein, partial [Pseudomonas sp. GL-B-12]|uniref:N-acetylmuramidase domain-containing protein n=1 Tax=Pseudomonas sp. GL-B-12 TaxID=2832374 RepID=UPI001CBBC061